MSWHRTARAEGLAPSYDDLFNALVADGLLPLRVLEVRGLCPELDGGRSIPTPRSPMTARAPVCVELFGRPGGGQGTFRRVARVRGEKPRQEQELGEPWCETGRSPRTLRAGCVLHGGSTRTPRFAAPASRARRRRINSGSSPDNTDLSRGVTLRVAAVSPIYPRTDCSLEQARQHVSSA